MIISLHPSRTNSSGAICQDLHTEDGCGEGEDDAAHVGRFLLQCQEEGSFDVPSGQEWRDLPRIVKMDPFKLENLGCAYFSLMYSLAPQKVVFHPRPSSCTDPCSVVSHSNKVGGVFPPWLSSHIFQHFPLGLSDNTRHQHFFIGGMFSIPKWYDKHPNHHL